MRQGSTTKTKKNQQKMPTRTPGNKQQSPNSTIKKAYIWPPSAWLHTGSALTLLISLPMVACGMASHFSLKMWTKSYQVWGCLIISRYTRTCHRCSVGDKSGEQSFHRSNGTSLSSRYYLVTHVTYGRGLPCWKGHIWGCCIMGTIWACKIWSM